MQRNDESFAGSLQSSHVHRFIKIVGLLLPTFLSEQDATYTIDEITSLSKELNITSEPRTALVAMGNVLPKEEVVRECFLIMKQKNHQAMHAILNFLFGILYPNDLAVVKAIFAENSDYFFENSFFKDNTVSYQISLAVFSNENVNNEIKAIIKKYYLLFGAHDRFFGSRDEEFVKLQIKLEEAAFILQPNDKITFFHGIPQNARMRIALHKLRREDPDLQHMPDKLLKNVLNNLVKPVEQPYKKFANLAFRRFRENYSGEMTPVESRDKIKLLVRLLKGKCSKQLLMRSQLVALQVGFAELGVNQKYPTKQVMNQLIDDVMIIRARLRYFVTAASDAFFKLNKTKHPQLSLLDRQKLTDLVDSIITTENIHNLSEAKEEQVIQDLVALFIKKITHIIPAPADLDASEANLNHYFANRGVVASITEEDVRQIFSQPKVSVVRENETLKTKSQAVNIKSEHTDSNISEVNVVNRGVVATISAEDVEQTFGQSNVSTVEDNETLETESQAMHVKEFCDIIHRIVYSWPHNWNVPFVAEASQIKQLRKKLGIRATEFTATVEEDHPREDNSSILLGSLRKISRVLPKDQVIRELLPVIMRQTNAVIHTYLNVLLRYIYSNDLDVIRAIFDNNIDFFFAHSLFKMRSNWENRMLHLRWALVPHSLADVDVREVLTYYFILFGANDDFFECENRCIDNIDHVLNSAVIILQPNHKMTFFAALPFKIRLRLAIDKLRKDDPWLKFIPDQLLVRALDDKFKSLNCGHERNAYLAVSEFRESFPKMFTPEESRNCVKLLSALLHEKSGNQSLTKAQRTALLVSFAKMGASQNYPNRQTMSKAIDNALLILKQLCSLVEMASEKFFAFNKAQHPQLSPLDQQRIIGLLDENIIADNVEGLHDDASQARVLQGLVELFERKIHHPIPNSVNLYTGDVNLTNYFSYRGVVANISDNDIRGVLNKDVAKQLRLN